MKSTLIQQYIAYTLEHDHTPASVYKFCQGAGITETVFYDHFSGFESLEASIFEEWFIASMNTCTSSEPWQGYSSREKILSVFFTFIETVRTQRSFILFLKKRDAKTGLQVPAYLKRLREVFVEQMKPIINEGLNSKELAERKYLDDKYVDGLWLNFLFVLKFWVDDTSPGFEKTDAAIEKSVNLAMDLMGKSALDAALDFGKFLFQNR